MKSHDFAQQLMLIAKMFKSAPNMDLDDMSFYKTTNLKSMPSEIKENDVPKALNMLVGLNNIEKSEWVNLIEEYKFDILIRPRDAKRDVIGKLLRYLADNPDQREKLTGGKKITKRNESSSELAEALSLLLG